MLVTFSIQFSHCFTNLTHSCKKMFWIVSNCSKMKILLFITFFTVISAVRFTKSSIQNASLRSSIPFRVRIRLMHSRHNSIRNNLITLAYKQNPTQWQRNIDSIAFLTFLKHSPFIAISRNFLKETKMEIFSTNEMKDENVDEFLKSVKNEIYKLYGM